MNLSIVINTKNASTTIDKALKSSQFADEIIIVDMHSSDNTVEIAKKYTNKIFFHRDLRYADPARDFALKKARGKWIFVLDADEEIQPSLQKKILEIISDKNTKTAQAYWVPRQNIVFGKAMEKTGWWPDYQMRLFKNGVVSWKVGVHRHPDINGEFSYLPADEKTAILHHNYQSVEQFLERLNRYTSLQAEEATSQNDFHISSSKVLQTFFDEFLSRLFSQKGIDEGVHGASLSLLQSCYQLATLLKQWQLNNFIVQDLDSEITIKSLKKFQKDLNYWIADWYVSNSTGIANIYWRCKRKLC